MGNASAWVHTVWRNAESHWSDRTGQDREYRTHVIHPALCGLLADNFPGNGLRILDLGCGDGVLLESDDCRKLIGNDGRYHGIDIAATLLARARANHDAANITFQRGNIGDPTFPGTVMDEGRNTDAVVSVFVIQEIPDLEVFMSNLAKLTPSGGLAVTVTVHPDFAGWLCENGRLKTEESLGGDDSLADFQWRWAGYYPIVDEVNGVFHLPHFQRTTGDYKMVMERHGFTVEHVIDLPEPTRDLPRLVSGGVSPFTPFADNFYWPRIGEAPSTVIFMARKEADRAIKG